MVEIFHHGSLDTRSLLYSVPLHSTHQSVCVVVLMVWGEVLGYLHLGLETASVYMAIQISPVTCTCIWVRYTVAVCKSTPAQILPINYEHL